MKQTKLLLPEITFISSIPQSEYKCTDCDIALEDCQNTMQFLTGADCRDGLIGYFKILPIWYSLDHLEDVEVGMAVKNAYGTTGRVLGTDEIKRGVVWKTDGGSVFLSKLNVLKFKK